MWSLMHQDIYLNIMSKKAEKYMSQLKQNYKFRTINHTNHLELGKYTVNS